MRLEATAKEDEYKVWMTDAELTELGRATASHRDDLVIQFGATSASARLKSHRFPDELAQTISLGSAGNGEDGQDWVSTYTPERENEEDREKVLVRLTPRALHELYIETKGLSTDQRMHGHSAECDLCGDQVDLDEAIPNPAANRVTSTAGLSIRVRRIGSVTTYRSSC